MQNAQKCLCGATNCRGILGPRGPKERAKAGDDKVEVKKATAVKKTKNGVIAKTVEKKIKASSRVR
jgi:[histone H3]-lysine4 N-trimethyltransferase ASH1L